MLRLFSTTVLFSYGLYGHGILIEISPGFFSAIIYAVIFRNKQNSKSNVCTDCAM